MDLKDIISITGKSGLYKIISQSPKGAIVESLDDEKKRFMVGANYKVAMLEEITIFTETNEDFFVKDVFKRIMEKDGENISVSPKDSTAILKNYFNEIMPEHDKERVYVSDIKKIIKWYSILADRKIITKKDISEEEVKASNEAEKEKKPETKKVKGTPKKKTNGTNK